MYLKVSEFCQNIPEIFRIFEKQNWHHLGVSFNEYWEKWDQIQNNYYWGLGIGFHVCVLPTGGAIQSDTIQALSLVTLIF